MHEIKNEFTLTPNTMDFSDLVEKLKEFDEIILLEKLDISSDEIIERFTDKIEEKFEELNIELEEEEEDTDDNYYDWEGRN